MNAAVLDAAGITAPHLRTAYESGRRLHARHGRTYYLATRLLPPQRRPYVHALYGFARYADDIVDRGPAAEAEHRLDRLQAAVMAPEADRTQCTALPEPGARVVSAVRDTLRRFDLPMALVADFLASMRTDLTVTDYPTFADLSEYTWGSAAVVGLLLLPVLGTVTDRDRAAPFAADLGVAFQLTNFLRDVAEDLHLGRIYLPLEDLARFGVTREDLQAGAMDDRIRALMAYQIARTRELYRRAEPGIALLAPESRPCVAAAHELYGRILTEIERADYDVFTHRARVPRRRRAAVLGQALMRRARVPAAAGSGRSR